MVSFDVPFARIDAKGLGNGGDRERRP